MAFKKDATSLYDVVSSSKTTTSSSSSGNYAAKNHTHVESDVTGLVDDLTNIRTDHAALAARVTAVETEVDSSYNDVDYDDLIGSSGALIGTLTLTDGEGNEDSIDIYVPQASAAVSSVNGLTGAVTLTYANVGAAAASHTHSDLEADITDLETDIVDLEADIAELEIEVDAKASASSVTALTTRVTAAESDITTLETSKADASHTHAISDVTNLQSTLTSKANVSDVTALTTRVRTAESTISTLGIRVNAAESDISNLETSKADTSHTHAISDVTNLQTTLDAKADNQTVSQLEDDVGSIHDDLDEVESDVASLTTTVSTLSTRVTSDEQLLDSAYNDVTYNNLVTDGVKIGTITLIGVDERSYHDDINLYVPQSSATVTSVNGKTGAVTLTNTDVGAAATTHTHTSSQISDITSTLTSGGTYAVTNGAVYTARADARKYTATTASTGTKLYLVGGSSQSANGVTTKSNVNCYIGTDNCLYSGGSKVLTALPSHAHESGDVSYQPFSQDAESVYGQVTDVNEALEENATFSMDLSDRIDTLDAEPKIKRAVYGTTTYAEIAAWHTAGHIVVVNDNSSTKDCYLSSIGTTNIYFFRIGSGCELHYAICNSSNVWSQTTYTLTHS